MASWEANNIHPPDKNIDVDFSGQPLSPVFSWSVLIEEYYVELVIREEELRILRNIMNGIFCLWIYYKWADLPVRWMDDNGINNGWGREKIIVFSSLGWGLLYFYRWLIDDIIHPSTLSGTRQFMAAFLTFLSPFRLSGGKGEGSFNSIQPPLTQLCFFDSVDCQSFC